MRYADIFTDIESIAALSSTTSALHNALKRGVRAALERYASSYPWPHYRERGFFTTVAPYVTGTVNVTNGSTSVTNGTGTTFTSAMVGRKFRVGSEIPWYDIDVVPSATTLTLRQAYQGSTQTAVSFTIFQDEYRLNGDTLRLNNLLQIQFGLPMVVLNYLDFDSIDTMSRSANDPIIADMVGRRDDRYTTGTITGSVGGTTLTGSGSAWTGVQGLSKGNRISLAGNSEVYTIKSVDSDTQLTVYEPISTAPTASTYVLYLNNIRLKVKQYPSSARNIYFSYQRTPYPLVNDYDEPDMPREFHYQLVWAGLSVAWAMKGNFAGSQDAEQKFETWIAQQGALLQTTAPDIRMVKNSMDRFWPIPIPPSYPPSYGIPLALT